MSAAVHGINAGVSKSMAAAGPSTFFITKWPNEITSCNGSQDSCPWRHNRPLTLELGREVEKLPFIQGVTAHINSSQKIRFADRSLPAVQVDGFTSGWLDVQGGDIIAGRNFTQMEEDEASNVLLVNEKVVDKLFSGEEAVGKTVRFGGQMFTVIGVFRPISNAFDSNDRGKTIVPYTTAQRRLNVGVYWMDLTVKPRDGVDR